MWFSSGTDNNLVACSAITCGFLAPENRALLTFLDKPADATDDFDWGEAALKAVEDWKAAGAGGGVPYNLQVSSRPNCPLRRQDKRVLLTSPCMLRSGRTPSTASTRTRAKRRRLVALGIDLQTCLYTNRKTGYTAVRVVRVCEGNKKVAEWAAPTRY